MRIVIAGGSGLLGSALVTACRAGGHEVAVLTRQPRKSGDIAWSPGTGAARWTRAVQDADVVVNLAGESIAEHRWTRARKAAIRSSRTIATRALASAIKTAERPPGCFISGSAIGFYGTRGDEPLTEASSPGSDFLAAVCREWEHHALDLGAHTRVVVLRTGVVLSASGGALPQFALPVRFFVGGPLGSGLQFISWIHLADWVAMVQWAIASAEISGPLNVTAPNPASNAEFTRVLGRVLHRPTFLPAPGIALRVLLGEMANALILGGQRVLPAKAVALGFKFGYPVLADALQEIYGDSRSLIFDS